MSDAAIYQHLNQPAELPQVSCSHWGLHPGNTLQSAYERYLVACAQMAKLGMYPVRSFNENAAEICRHDGIVEFKAPSRAMWFQRLNFGELP